MTKTHTEPEIEAACRALIHDLTVFVDHHRPDAATALFAQDATWLRGGKLYSGHSEIRTSFAGTAGQLFRHYVSTISFDLSVPEQPQATTYYSLFKVPKEVAEADLPLPIPQVFSMGEWYDSFCLEGEIWRIASRKVHRMFQAT